MKDGDGGLQAISDCGQQADGDGCTGGDVWWDGGTGGRMVTGGDGGR